MEAIFNGAAFCAWWRNLSPPEAQQFLDYSNDYYVSRELAKQRADDDVERYESYTDDGPAGGYESDDSNLSSDREANSEEWSLTADESLDHDFISDDTAVLSPTTTFTHLMERGPDAAYLVASQVVPPLLTDYGTIDTEDIDHCIALAEESFIARDQTPPLSVVFQANGIFPTQVEMLASALNGADT
ncbi:hypothetical protein PPTG_03596 [Phytophthora nicotianae INRA-310]|uniref:Uncharacterized protein n=3 Tax=Phytophthora nicotianae TaxID=4792 RepID=W2R7E4_PHYN3|nr:hypothetical protein PPTG_03596 [Phytophthora nicotianae INRA-310]ETN20629.1 hypothetical protein PPTG_03596 [Phytophthora nicotianae INRA-310]